MKKIFKYYFIKFFVGKGWHNKKRFYLLWRFITWVDIFLNGIFSNRSPYPFLTQYNNREHCLWIQLNHYCVKNGLGNFLSIYWDDETNNVLNDNVDDSFCCAIHPGFGGIFKWIYDNNRQGVIISNDPDLPGITEDVIVIPNNKNCLIQLLKEHRKGKVAIVAIDKVSNSNNKYSLLSESALMASMKVYKKVILVNDKIDSDGRIVLKATCKELNDNNFHSTIIEWAKAETGSQEWRFL